ncbi:MAG: hypothetical protein JWM90_647 [Thermoleophilia bacterium]|nr:hypothetical protein [Thermoleophilia bacterium]
MENLSLAEHLGANVRQLRKDRGLSLAEVSARMTTSGVPLSLNGLSKVELGNRELNLDELVALAAALGVPPLVVLFPLGRQREVALLPGMAVGTWAAAKWFAGEAALPGSDESLDEAPTTYFREQDRLIAECRAWRGKAAEVRTRLGGKGWQTETDRPDLALVQLQEAEWLEQALRTSEDQLRRHRSNMRKANLDPGELPPELVHVDEQRG